MSKIEYPNVFVTVGTTQFDDLIDSLNSPETAQILEQLGCSHLSVQFGAGQPPKLSTNYRSILTESFAYKSSILADVSAADLVISHAGAGSIIETLKAGKPMVVVVNELLMDNHQTELAEQMSEDGHVLYCVPRTLPAALAQLFDNQLRPYGKGNISNFTNQLNQLMGFD